MNILTIVIIGILGAIFMVAGVIACLNASAVGKKHLPAPLAGFILLIGIVLLVLFIALCIKGKKEQQQAHENDPQETTEAQTDAPEEEHKFLGGLFDKPEKEEAPAEDTASDQTASDESVPDEGTTDEVATDTADDGTVTDNNDAATSGETISGNSVSDNSADAAETEEEEPGWWTKTWNNVKGFFTGLFGGNKSKETATNLDGDTTEADLESAKEAGTRMAEVGKDFAEALQAQMETEVWQEAAERVRTFNEQLLTNSYEYDPEEEKLPAVRTDNSVFREYQKLYAEDIAFRGVRIEMSDFKTHIAEWLGYDCTDGVAFPLWSTDWDFYNQLSGAFPVTRPELEGVNLRSTASVNAVIEKHEETLKKEWEDLSKLDQIDASEEELYRRIYNCPEMGIGYYDMMAEIPLFVTSYPNEFAEIKELIDEAYAEKENEEDPVGIDYFLVYNSQEHADNGEDQYSHTSVQYRKVIAVRVIAYLKQVKAKGFMSLWSSWNLCRPPVSRDSICRLIPATYQENRPALVFECYGKNGQLLVRFGANRDDSRPEIFAKAKPKTTTVTEKQTPEDNKKKQVTQTTTSNDTPSDTTPPGGGGGGDNPPPPPPPPGVNKDPADEPTQTGEGGDKGGGDNSDNKDGGDQNTDDARGEENEDRENKDTTGGGGENTENTENTENNNENTENTENSGDGNHDTGGDNSAIEDSGHQGGTTTTDNGDGTTTETSGNTGNNGGKDSSSTTVEDF